MKPAFNASYITSILVGLFGIITVSAQDYTFKVLVNKGKNEVKLADGWQSIRVGVSLGSADELRVVENSYVGLVHVNGKPLEVKQAGTYKVVDLAAKVSSGTSVLNKYTDFILSQNSERKNTLVATGAVHRGLGIDVYLPRAEYAQVYGNKVSVNWNTEKNSGPYIVTFKSIFGDELAKIKTDKDVVEVNLSDEKFKGEENILVEVVTAGNVSGTPDTYMLKKLTEEEKQRVQGMSQQIESSLADRTALNQLILAAFYEENQLLIDATTAYIEAMKLAPEVESYKDLYHQFLLRQGLKENE